MSVCNETTIASANRSGASPVWGIVCVGVAGLGISCLLYSGLSKAEENLIHEEFKQRASDRMISISNEFKSGAALVHSLVAHMRASRGANDANFRSFARHLLSQETAMHALSWNRRVRAQDLPAHVARLRSQDPGYTPTEMTPDAGLSEIDLHAHTPNSRDRVLVECIEPFESNRSAIGFDIRSEAIRRDTLHRARDSGQTAATGGIRLIQDEGGQSGMLVMAPIYEHGAETTSAEQRLAHFEGVVVGVLRIGSTVASAMSKLEPAGIDVCLFEGDASEENPPLYIHFSRKRHHAMTPMAELESMTRHAFCEKMSFPMAGKQWTVCCTPTTEFLASRATWTPTAVLLAGLAGTLTLASYLFNLTRLNDRLRHQIAMRAKVERSLEIAQHSIDSSHIPIFWIGPDARFRFVNQAAAASLGFDIQTLSNMGLADITPTWSEEEWHQSWTQLKVSGAAIYESHHQRSDGSVFPVQVMTNYLSYGQQEFMFCLVMDITQRKQQQDRIREQEQVLTHFSRLSTLGEMVAGIAHEINQPLSAISCLAGACHEAISSSGHHFQHPVDQWSKQIGEQAVVCGDIIRQLRGFVKKGDTRWQRVALNKSISDSISLVANDARDRAIRIQCDPVEPTLCVDGNQVQIQQVIVNLLRNACDAVSQNDFEDRQVLIRARQSRGRVEVVVEDHGPGIDPQHRHQLFDLFFTTKANGIGMGLAISRSIVEAHRGRLWVDSATPKGSRFHVELPAVA